MTITFMGKLTRRKIYDSFPKDLTYPYPNLVFWCRLSPTLGRLKACGKKDHDKFEAYFKLINALVKMARDAKDKREYTVHAPSVSALLGIRIDALMQNKEARRDIVKQCWRPEIACVDLRRLISINHKYFPELEIKD